MNPYHVYLKAELSKYETEDSFQLLINQHSASINEFRFTEKQIKEYINFFSIGDDIPNDISKQNQDRLIKLCRLFSCRIRKNPVFQQIQEANDTNWNCEIVSISLLYTMVISEREVTEIFCRHNGNIVKIANDNGLYQFKPYSEFKPNEVKYKTLLAKKKNGIFQVFDGIHRALFMAYMKQETANVCYKNIY
jgi:hypothetical protein